MRTAVVLAGGFSTRFGDQDKATARIDGVPLLRRVCEGVAPAADEVVVNCRREQRDRIAAALDGLDEAGVTFAVDPIPDRGPVAGIRNGCRAAGGDWAFVVACDMPFVRPRLPATLFDVAELADRVPGVDSNAMLPDCDGRRQPFGAVYRADEVAETADSLLDDGRGAMRDLLDRLSTLAVPSLLPARTYDDVDTREELRAAERRCDFESLRTDCRDRSMDGTTENRDRRASSPPRSLGIAAESGD